jgi:hypothetical protein
VLLLNDGAKGLGSPQQGRELAQASGGSSRRRSTRARSTRASPCAAATSARVVHNFSLLTDELGRGTRSWRTSCRTTTRSSSTLAGQDARCGDPAEAARPLQTTQTTLARSRRWPTSSGRRWRRSTRGQGAAPVAAPDAPVPARDDADHPRRDPALHARRAADRQGAAPGDARPGGGHARPDGVLQRRQPAPEHGRLQPARRQGEGYLFWQSWVNHAGNRSSPPPDAHGPIRPRPRRAVVPRRPQLPGRGRACQPDCWGT